MRGKQGGGRNQAQRRNSGGGRSGSGGGGYCSDPLLVPRIEDYAQNNDFRDVDQVVEYLRRVGLLHFSRTRAVPMTDSPCTQQCRHNYREYQRKQLLPLKKVWDQNQTEVAAALAHL